MPNQFGRLIQQSLTNMSGGDLAKGDVVIYDIANALSVTTTSTVAFVDAVIGVVIEPNGIPAGEAGMICFAGPVDQINLDASATNGDFVYTSSVAGQGTPHAVPGQVGDFAMVQGTGTTPPAMLGLPFAQSVGGGGDNGAITGPFALETSISPTALSGTTNNYNPTDLATAAVIRLTATAAHNLTGLAGGSAGRVIVLYNIGATHRIILKANDGGSSAANQFGFHADFDLVPSGGCVLVYDDTASLWRLAGVSFGLAVSELFGAVNVYGARKLTVPDGSLTDVGGGDASINFNVPVDHPSHVAQTADIGSTNFANASGGLFSISAYLAVSTADGAAGTVTLTITWNDGIAVRTSTLTLPLTSTGFQPGTIVAHPQTGSISYAVSHTGSYGTAQYQVFMSVERKY